ncbi:hypothetical protein VE25_02955 [Devosia geojensis]|uniref:Uncharacterized protein n=1 Tax=Devosia geojensis TaxID=443610 RepID=A0A0F5FWJ5_9HYPH|nr:hypothetical protein VE25_02955 [Devosia geojensis]
MSGVPSHAVSSTRARPAMTFPPDAGVTATRSDGRSRSDHAASTVSTPTATPSEVTTNIRCTRVCARVCAASSASPVRGSIHAAGTPAIIVLFFSSISPSLG